MCEPLPDKREGEGQYPLVSGLQPDKCNLQAKIRAEYQLGEDNHQHEIFPTGLERLNSCPAMREDEHKDEERERQGGEEPGHPDEGHGVGQG